MAVMGINPELLEGFTKYKIGLEFKPLAGLC